MDYFNNHKRLYLTALSLFLFLTIMVAIRPALTNQKNNGLLPGYELPSDDEVAGKALYISNGCVACHTQQVRNVAMDQTWGSRPGLPADYAGIHREDFWRNTATLMGTERTGPDLTDIGNRQPSKDWHLLHLYQPRAVVKESIMPAFPWLFTEKDRVERGDTEIQVPEAFRNGIKGKIIATNEALQLLAYIKSLKQIKLYEKPVKVDFLYKGKISAKGAAADAGSDEGQVLYATNCQSCHQSNGEGLKGAFPPLKGSPIVLNDNPELYINIIMKGYDAREEYGVMPPVGTNANLTAEQVTAIIGHERSSWGNKGRKISVAEVRKIMDLVKAGK